MVEKADYRNMHHTTLNTIKINLVIPFIVLATLTISYFYLNSHKGSLQERKAVLSEIADANFGDTDKFNAAIKELGELENKAIAPLSDTSLTNIELKNKIERICIPSWNKADSILKETQNYKLSESQLNKSKKLLEYVALRKNELDIFKKMIGENNSENYLTELEAVRLTINKIVEEIQKL